MSRNRIVIAAIAVILLAAAGIGAWYIFGSGQDSMPAPQAESAAPSAAGGPVPAPVMLVVDKGAIMEGSKAGQDIGRQVQAFAAQARGELSGQMKALQSEGQTLKAQAAGMAPDVRDKRIAAFEAKQAALQQVTAKKEDQIKQAVAKAQQTLSQKLGPILKQIMDERHANMIVDKQAVVFGTDPSLDVSMEAIKRLDVQLPSVHVDLAQAPAPISP
ncbi:MAG TPA: OmpH family outer membrane protein [Rhizomicrobium sp.]|nr:OmpH family outer membrane protein [Rhizomicrobium sp.]